MNIQSARFIFLLVTLATTAGFAQSEAITPIDIYQPPVMCPEEAVPSLPSDHIVNENFGNHSDIEQVLKKNNGVPDESDANYQSDWLLLKGAENARSKIDTIYQAANRQRMPVQVLVGALLQESSMVDLGISEDYGNWSCGIGQLNLIEWCTWAKNETPEMKKSIQWPSDVVAQYEKENPGQDICGGDFIRAAHVKPFHDIGLRNLRSDGINHSESFLLGEHIIQGGSVSYPTVARELHSITLKKMKCSHRHREDDECLKIKTSTNERTAQFLRYLLTKNFAENCSSHKNMIQAKAFTLKQLFDAMPTDIKISQKYKSGNTFNRACLQKNITDSVPLHVGWLLSDAVYNAGQEIIPGIYNYKIKNKLSWDAMTPSHLAKAIDSTLKIKRYSKQLTKIGREEAHYHIRNVIQNVSDDETIVEPYVVPTKNKKTAEVDEWAQ